MSIDGSDIRFAPYEIPTAAYVQIDPKSNSQIDIMGATGGLTTTSTGSATTIIDGEA